MRKEHTYFVYILASRSRTLYVGVTNNIDRRLAQHRAAPLTTFTARYQINRLVHFERFAHVACAISREKYLKHGTRSEKLALIEEANSTWIDLSQTFAFHSHQQR